MFLSCVTLNRIALNVVYLFDYITCVSIVLPWQRRSCIIQWFLFGLWVEGWSGVWYYSGIVGGFCCYSVSSKHEILCVLKNRPRPMCSHPHQTIRCVATSCEEIVSS